MKTIKNKTNNNKKITHQKEYLLRSFRSRGFFVSPTFTHKLSQISKHLFYELSTIYRMDVGYFPLQRAEMNLSGLLSQNDIKATKTVAMTITAFFFCYVPVIVYAVIGQHDGRSQADSWFSFLSWFTLLFSTVVNPIIYYLRSSRFRSAFKQFIKDPFGSNDFKENSRWSGKGKKQQSRTGIPTRKGMSRREAKKGTIVVVKREMR